MSCNWTPEEDEQLKALVEKHGPKKWALIASELKTKGSKQCRRRWKNCLNADLKTGGWTPEEDDQLIELHSKMGNRWTEIANAIGGRTDNAVKNRYAALSKKSGRIRKAARHRPAYNRAAAADQALRNHRRGGASDDDDDDEPMDDGASDSDHKPRSSARRVRRPLVSTGNTSAGQAPGAGPPRFGGLSIAIPDDPGAAPAASQPVPPLPLHVDRNILSPLEIQGVQEINSLGMPLHIELENGPMTSARAQGILDMYRMDTPLGALPTPALGDVRDVMGWLQTPRAATAAAGPQGQAAPQQGAAQRNGGGDGPLQPLKEEHRSLLSKVITLGMRNSQQPAQGGQAQGQQGQPAAQDPGLLRRVQERKLRQAGLQRGDSLGRAQARAAEAELDVIQPSDTAASPGPTSLERARDDGGVRRSPRRAAQGNGAAAGNADTVDVVMGPAFRDEELQLLLEALNDKTVQLSTPGGTAANDNIFRSPRQRRLGTPRALAAANVSLSPLKPPGGNSIGGLLR
ncbi:unnamed protein product [Pedinophyceae sp. YPF-701]|nr:unnamed protein product [Pedinophyceae sp. YPF-701]